MKNINSYFDIVVIGGGATGCGVALDASSRGFKTLLLEKKDFASGTSGRSTKLLHGGVRYLESAIKNLDKNQYNLVKNSLHERYILLKNAPHLCHKTTLLTPIYKWTDVPYIFAGLTIYDLLAGKMSIGRSSFISRQKTLEEFPLIKQDALKGCIKYYDGQFNDMRMNITVAKTAQHYGASILNYSEVTEIIKENGKIKGVVFLDKIKKEKKEILCTALINATGVFSDNIRKMDNPDCANIMQISSGIHIVIDKKYAPKNGGVLIPKTDDGRVLFMLPWENSCIVGTTDEPHPLSDYPSAKESEIKYLINHINRYFDVKITTNDIKSIWAGLRPLVKDSYTHSSTASIVRDHYIELSNSGLITITGGKWTSFRKMAEDTIDKAISIFQLRPKRQCITKNIKYYGSNGFNMFYKYQFMEHKGLDYDISKYLLRNYGIKAQTIAKMAQNKDFGERLINNMPYIKAEVVYSIKNEYAKKPLDFIIRRTAIAQTNMGLAKNILDKIIEIFAEELEWSNQTKNREKIEALHILNNAI